MPEPTVLAAFAHPDDESILAGGLLAMLVERGASLHLLLATRGEGGERGEPPLIDRARLGSMREAELRCAASALGASSVTFLDYVDPQVGEDQALYPFDAVLEDLASEISTVMLATQAEVLISHGSNGEYGHPGHTLMHRASKLALQTTTGASIPLYSISAAFTEHPRPRLANQDDPATFVIDIEPWFDAKLKAAECHRTQAALFVRRSSRKAGRSLSLREVLMKVESIHRAWPPLDAQIDDQLASFLEKHCRAALVQDFLPGLPDDFHEGNF